MEVCVIMSTISDNIVAILIDNDHFFDFVDITGNICVTDYCHLNKELVLSGVEGREGDLKLGKERKKMRVDSISDLQSIFNGLIKKVIVMISKNGGIKYTVSEIYHTDGKRATISFDNMYDRMYPLDFRLIDIKLLVNQLTFDVLFHKYQIKSAEKMMTRSGYAKHMSEMLSQNSYSFYDMINKSMERSMEKHYHLLKYSKIGDQLIWLGVDRDKYAEYYNPQISLNLTAKKPKCIWDYLYYNHNLNLTYRQYRRQVTKKNRNYSYEEFIRDLKEYNDFVKKLLPMNNESSEKYFVKSMEYYALESYKRIDFIFNIINTIPEMDIKEINKNHFLVKRFCPRVLVLFENNNELQVSYKNKYYRPLFFIEELIQQKLQNDNLSYAICEDLLSKYQYIRAKTYELFNYYYEYNSCDYNEIKMFIEHCYNMREYHEKNEIWKIIEDKEWKDMDSDMKLQIKKLVQNFIKINDALFWEATDRKIDIPKDI